MQLANSLWLLIVTALAGLCWAGPAEARNPVVPKTSVSYWNRSGVQERNNCYNYATNRRTDGFAQPGQASGIRFGDISCSSLLSAAAADQGLTRTRSFPLDEGGGDTLVALVVAPGYDFHWYRRDSSGNWSHKPGQLGATTVDNNGKVIRSPESAARGAYTQFCGYFKLRSYPKAQHQQNSGYVRIGTMSSLPELPQSEGLDFVPPESPAIPDASEVEVLMYSGRPNPRIPLRELLADPALRDSLREYRDHERSGASEAAPAPHLGDNGISIRDAEGLLFAKGEVVYLRAAPLSHVGNHDLHALPAEDPVGRLAAQIREFVLRR